MQDKFSYCEQLVREADKDRFLAGLFAPADRRDPLFALYAFNVEVARVRELVHEPLAGEVRLQWWRDALKEQAHGEVRANPVADALLDTIAQFKLPSRSIPHRSERSTLRRPMRSFPISTSMRAIPRPR
jgi:phytoene synthase